MSGELARHWSVVRSDQCAHPRGRSWHESGPAAIRAARTKAGKLDVSPFWDRVCSQLHNWLGHLPHAPPPHNPIAATQRWRDPSGGTFARSSEGAKGSTGQPIGADSGATSPTSIGLRCHDLLPQKETTRYRRYLAFGPIPPSSEIGMLAMSYAHGVAPVGCVSQRHRPQPDCDSGRALVDCASGTLFQYRGCFSRTPAAVAVARDEIVRLKVLAEPFRVYGFSLCSLSTAATHSLAVHVVLGGSFVSHRRREGRFGVICWLCSGGSLRRAPLLPRRRQAPPTPNSSRCLGR